MNTDSILEQTLKSFADNYNIATNESERFRTDREALNFIDATIKQPELREHYKIRYEQYKDM